MGIAIAIDGPAGAGKSTVAKAVAKALNYIYIDTGAMYRAVTLGCMRAGFNPAEETDRTVDLLPTLHVVLTPDARVLLNGEDVTRAIRTEECSRLTSPTSAIPEVRLYLVAQQRRMALEGDTVMDGRDIGSNVLPDAQVKIFMTATPEVRAKRRYLENLAVGITTPIDIILEEIRQRDYNDSHRALNPLTVAEDAVVLDTSEMTVEENVQAILKIVEDKTGVKPSV